MARNVALIVHFIDFLTKIIYSSNIPETHPPPPKF